MGMMLHRHNTEVADTKITKVVEKPKVIKPGKTIKTSSKTNK